MFFIYILYATKFDKHYIGYSDNPNRRLDEHNNSNHNTFTAKYRPWVIKLVFPVSESRTVAMRVERFIKKQKSVSFLDKLLVPDFRNKIIQLLVRVPHPRD